jgi:O-antigen ligase
VTQVRAVESPGPADRVLFASLALALFVIPLAFAPALYDDFTLIKQSLLLASAALALVGLATLGFPLPASRLVRIGLATWIAALVLSEALSPDWRSSLLGVYQYRQGLLTQVSYVILMLAASRAVSAGYGRRILLLPAAALCGAGIYVAVQSAGHDPVSWWVDTSRRAFGTIGNANELAAYAVLALSPAGLLANRPGRRALSACIALVSLSVFCVLQAESRSGLAALGLFAILVPAMWIIAKAPRRELARFAVLGVAGTCIALLASALVGGVTGSASRLESGVTGHDPGGSTRIELWRGTMNVIAARPLQGAGPDGLWLAFPRYRPANLGGAFSDYDLTAQSSHNFVLDTAANYGVGGFAGLGLIVAGAIWSAFRRRRDDTSSLSRSEEPAVWAALGAYAALTLVNPVSISAQPLAFVILGVLAGPARPVQWPSFAGTRQRFAFAALAAPAVMLLLALAIALPVADWHANRGWEAYDRMDFAAAAHQYRAAETWMPFERHYAQGTAGSWAADAVLGPRESVARAESAYTRLDRKVGFSAGDALALAALGIIAGDDPSRVTGLIDRSLELNPHGIAMQPYTQRLRAALTDGGLLRYSRKDHWVYIQLRFTVLSTPAERLDAAEPLPQPGP